MSNKKKACDYTKVEKIEYEIVLKGHEYKIIAIISCVTCIILFKHAL